MKTSQILVAARGVMPKVVEIRRHLHQNPETRWKEDGTLEYIRQRVPAVFTGEPQGLLERSSGGIVLDLTYDPNWDRILFRADVDALPIQEETDLPFASQNPGVMHACGHDMHTAMLLGAMKAIAAGAVQPTHNLRFVFQRAEENPGTDPRPESGGWVLVDEGVLDGISAVYGLHIGADKPAGVFMSRGGPMMANSDRLKVEITCSGGHVMSPHKGTNAIDVGVRICQELEGFALRTLGPNEPISLVPAIFQSGTASNIRPGKAELWFAVRNMLDEEYREHFRVLLEQHIMSLSICHSGADIKVTYVHGHPALINDCKSFEGVQKVLQNAGFETQVQEQNFGGEDFAYYLRRCPGSFWFLGAENPDMPGGHHTATFNPREEEMEKGVAFWLALATSPSP